jgi:hypothetical protein
MQCAGYRPRIAEGSLQGQGLVETFLGIRQFTARQVHHGQIVEQKPATPRG